MAKKVKIFSTYDLDLLAKKRRELDEAGILYTVKSGSTGANIFYLITNFFAQTYRDRNLLAEDPVTHPLYTIYVNEEDGPKAMMNDYK